MKIYANKWIFGTEFLYRIEKQSINGHFNFMKPLRFDNEIPIFKINYDDNWFNWTKHEIHAIRFVWIDLDGLIHCYCGWIIIMNLTKNYIRNWFWIGIRKYCSIITQFTLYTHTHTKYQKMKSINLDDYLLE